MTIKNTLRLSVVIPCHNEADNIVSLVSRLTTVFQGNNIDGEIIFVDDNSTDDTAMQVNALAQRYKRIKLIERKDGKCGVDRTLKAGFEHAGGDIIITMDGDLSHDPSDIPNFLRKIEAGADLVIGSRYGEEGGEAHMPVSRRMLSGGYSRLTKFLFHIKLTDLTSGYRAIRKDALDRLHLGANGFAIHAEIHLKALNSQLQVTQIPIVYHRRLSGSSKLSYLRVGIPYLKVLAQESCRRLGNKVMHQKPTQNSQRV